MWSKLEIHLREIVDIAVIALFALSVFLTSI